MIAIKGMEMPVCCFKCSFIDDEGWCLAVERPAEVYEEVRPDWCPLVEAKPIKHGHWIERESGIEDKEAGFETVIVCSCCDFPDVTYYSEDCESRTQIRTDYCPNCGAKMDGGCEDA